MTRSIYRRLTGRARTLGGYSQLWIAADHILLVRSARFNEHYQRFALADIQAVVITEEPSRTPLQAALGATALLWTLGFLLVSSTFAKGFFGVTGALALASVVLDMARGRRCRCHLHTAVSRELLAPVARMRIARGLLEKLQPAIEAVQGAVPIERISAIEERTSAFAAAGPAAAVGSPEISIVPGYLAEVVFGMFLINAGLILASVFWSRGTQPVTNALLSTLPAEIVTAIVALIRRGSRDPRRFIYPLIMIGLLGTGWDLAEIGRHFGAWFASVTTAAQRGNPAPIAAFFSFFDHTHALIAAGWRAVAGVVGLAAALWQRQKSAASRAQAAAP